MKVLKMGNRFLMALYRPSKALLDQIFMQRWGISIAMLWVPVQVIENRSLGLADSHALANLSTTSWCLSIHRSAQNVLSQLFQES